MNNVEIETDEINQNFLLTTNTDQILKNHRARFYFLDFLHCKIEDKDQIAIPYAGDREKILEKIQAALTKFRVGFVPTENTKRVLNAFFAEERNFAEFSEKARLIWHNEVDVKEFKDFADKISLSLPGRRLYDKQLLAAYHLTFAQNACNFSVPGAGKTSVVYAAFSFLRNLPSNHPKHVDKLLIIGPLSSFGPWEDEYKECFGKPVVSKRLSGGVNPAERSAYLRSIDPPESIPNLTLMSYQSVSFNLANLTQFLSRTDLRFMVVLDEAHKIKNTDGGVWATSILALSKLPGVAARVVLTGTPVPNGYADIYNLYDFIWPDKKIIRFSVQHLQDMSEKPFDPRVEKLIENISPFFIRIRKSDLGLPAATENDPTLVPMGAVQKEIYSFIENKYMAFFEDLQQSAEMASKLVQARLIRLMQVATNPSLLKKPLESFYKSQGLGDELYIDDRSVLNKILQYKSFEPVPSKFIEAKDLIQQLLSRNEKVIVWCTFIQNIIEFQGFLKEHSIASELLYGEIPTDTDDTPDDVFTREKIIKEFHSPESSFKVLIANPFAVSESISLHKVCHSAIYLERSFNAGNFLQSKDRIHRYGLKPGTATNYYYFLATDTIDETIHLRLIAKEKRMIELMESQPIPLIAENANFDDDLENDLKAVIKDYVRRTAKV